jgi:transposase
MKLWAEIQISRKSSVQYNKTIRKQNLSKSTYRYIRGRIALDANEHFDPVVKKQPKHVEIYFHNYDIYEGVSKSFRTGRLERDLQMVQLAATSCITIL